MSDLTLFGIIGSCVSLILIIHMWTWRKGPTHWKLLWTVLLFFIYVGPIFYLALYNPPPKRSMKQLIEESKFWHY